MKAERISHLFADPGPFASVFVDVSRNTESGAHEVEVRIRNATDRLAAAGAPDAVVELVVERLGESHDVPAPASQVVVATSRGVLLDDIVHAHTPRTAASWDALPDLTDWIACVDGAVTFVLALVDHEGGEVLTYGVDRSAEPVTASSHQGEDPHEHKVRGGGLAHRRYQRSAENVWAANAKAVAELLRSRISDGVRLIVLAGDPTSRTQVRAALDEDGTAEVVELEHGGRARDGGDEALHEAIREVLAEHTVAERLAASHDLRERLGRGNGAVTGIRDTADAFVMGQVETLLIDPDEAGKDVVKPGEHPGLALAETSSTREVRADLGLVAAAARTGAETMVLPSRALYGASVAALLRWPDTQ